MLWLVTVASTSVPPGMAFAPTAGAFPPGAAAFGAAGSCARPAVANPIPAPDKRPVRIILGITDSPARSLPYEVYDSVDDSVESPAHAPGARKLVALRLSELYESCGSPPRDLNSNCVADAHRPALQRSEESGPELAIIVGAKMRASSWTGFPLHGVSRLACPH